MMTKHRSGLRLGAWASALVLAGVLACGRQEAQRSDAAITTEVETQLALQEDLAGAQIEASALNGEVTLTGIVPTEEARDHAEDVAEDVSGVSRVDNRLRVSSGTDETAPVGAPSGGR
jgi:osmotically-inducible protein OsmY